MAEIIKSYEFLKLQKLRADKGLRKSELAAISGLAVNTIATAEKRSGNKYETLMKIFNVLNGPQFYNGALKSDEFVKEKRN